MVINMKNLLLVLMLLPVISSGVSHAETIMIKNAKIHTLGTQGTLTNGSILIVDGKITTVGYL